VGKYFVKGANSDIARADVARFILDVAENGLYVREAVAMAVEDSPRACSMGSLCCGAIRFA